MRVVFTLSATLIITLSIITGLKTPFAQYRYEIQPSGNEKFGAIAYSSSTGKTGNSWNHNNLTAAQNAALASCDQDDCKVAIWFKNACGALAVGNNGCWEAHWGVSRSDAENKSLNSCSQRCSDCKIISWACTDH